MFLKDSLSYHPEDVVDVLGVGGASEVVVEVLLPLLRQLLGEPRQDKVLDGLGVRSLRVRKIFEDPGIRLAELLFEDVLLVEEENETGFPEVMFELERCQVR